VIKIKYLIKLICCRVYCLLLINPSKICSIHPISIFCLSTLNNNWPSRIFHTKLLDLWGKNTKKLSFRATRSLRIYN